MPAKTKTDQEFLEIPILDVRAAAMPESLDEEGRRVTFVASTGARGLRRHWRGNYYEELEVSAKAVRLERLNNGAPFLNTHDSWDVSTVLGVIERGWIEKNQLLITVRFSEREEVEPIYKDIANGILPHVSVGYMVHEYSITDKEGELDIYRGVDWEPMEVSIVPMGFDDQAIARSGAQDRQRTSQVKINRAATEAHTRTEGTTMPEEIAEEVKPGENPEDQTRNGGDPATPPTPDPEALSKDEVERIAREAVTESQKTERERVKAIRSAVRSAKLPEEFALDLIADHEVTVEEARKRILKKWESEDASDEVRSIRSGTDDGMVENIRAAASNALMHRADPGKHKIEEAAKHFGGMSLIRLSEELLTLRGVSTSGMSQTQIAVRALSTSDLANITANVADNSLLMGYEATPRTFAGVFRQTMASNFKQMQRTRLSGAPKLERIRESGEFTYGSVSDEKEVYQLATYGKILTFTRETIINDDLDALSRIPMAFGASAADLENEIVWGIVEDNAALSDGVALFHADHNNLAAAGGAPSVATIGAGRKSMREQTAIEGKIINVMARYIISGAEHETVIDQLLSNIQAQQATNVVPEYIRSLTPVIEPRIEGEDWYLAADYNRVDTVEYAYLDGNMGVYLETREGFHRDGIEIKARHDFAAKAIDHRGLYKNPGE